jgi:hypothetical protein
MVSCLHLVAIIRDYFRFSRTLELILHEDRDLNMLKFTNLYTCSVEVGLVRTSRSRPPRYSESANVRQRFCLEGICTPWGAQTGPETRTDPDYWTEGLFSPAIGKSLATYPAANQPKWFSSLTDPHSD